MGDYGFTHEGQVFTPNRTQGVAPSDSAARNTDIRLALAHRLVQRQRIDEAIEHLWRTFDLSDELEARLGIVGDLADQYNIAGRSKQLIERLERIRRDREDAFGPTLYLVEAHARAGDYVSARRELNSLLSRRPDDVRVLAQLVALSERLGDSEKAVEYQQKAVEEAGDRHMEDLSDFLKQLKKEQDR